METAWPRPGIWLKQTSPAAEWCSEKGFEQGETPSVCWVCRMEGAHEHGTSFTQRGTSSGSHTGCVPAGEAYDSCTEAAVWLSGFKSCQLCDL